MLGQPGMINHYVVILVVHWQPLVVTIVYEPLLDIDFITIIKYGFYNHYQILIL